MRMAQTLTNRPVSVHEYLKGEQASEIRHEYVLIAQDLMRVEIYRRANEWGLEIYEQGDRIQLDTVQLELTVEELYEGIEWERNTGRQEP